MFSNKKNTKVMKQLQQSNILVTAWLLKRNGSTISTRSNATGSIHSIQKAGKTKIHSRTVSLSNFERLTVSEWRERAFWNPEKLFSRISRESVVSCEGPPGKRTKIGPNIPENFLLTEEVLLPSVLNFYVHSPKTAPFATYRVKTTTDVISFWVTLHI